jgi:hypothetical protein
VDKALEYDAHEAGGAHVEKAAEAGSSAWSEGCMRVDILEIFRRGLVVFEAAFLADYRSRIFVSVEFGHGKAQLTSPIYRCFLLYPNLFKGGVVDVVLTLETINMSRS